MNPDRPTARFRPVAIPDDVDDPGIVKASGRVRLPLHVFWSGPAPQDKEWNLDDPAERGHLYEIVLQEGSEDDVRRFIVIDELVALWSRLFLPHHVRRAWGEWLRDHRGLRLPTENGDRNYALVRPEGP